jgi:1-phosphatidylinositol phosphodiesterase
MSYLSDNIEIRRISIPGTHDSATYNYRLTSFGILRDLTLTQSLSIAQQLNSGIRFLDIRCRHVSNEFIIYHGFVNLNLNFDQIIQYARDFLQYNPTETILMRIKEEYTSLNNDRSFDETFNQYFQQNLDVFWKPISTGYSNTSELSKLNNFVLTN